MTTKKTHEPWVHFLFIIGSLTIASLVLFFSYTSYIREKQNIEQLSGLTETEQKLTQQLLTVKKELLTITNDDQFIKNKKLEEEIKNINTTYQDSVKVYEKLLELKDMTKNTDKLDKQFSTILTMLALKNYASASSVLSILDKQIATEREKIATSFTIPQNVLTNNEPPGRVIEGKKFPLLSEII